MAFVIWYEPEDLNWISNGIASNLSSIPVADRNLARNYWQGGIRDYATAPLGHHPNDNNAPLARQLVCTYGTLDEFRALLHRLADAIGGDALYLHALANDMGGWWGGQDPYP